MRGALDQKHRLVSLDEIRRVFESFGQDLYETLGFYERCAEALAVLLAEKEIISRPELEVRMEAIGAARGQRVDHVAKTVTP